VKNMILSKRYLLVAVAASAVLAVLLAVSATPKPPPPVTCTATRVTVLLGGVSGSQRGPTQRSRFLAHAKNSLYQSTVCGGSAVIEVWSTAGSVRVLWGRNDTIAVAGATTRSRQLAAARVIPAAMGTITARYDAALSDLPARGSAFLAWRTIAADALAELDPAQRPVAAVEVVDDGVQVDDTINLNRPLTTADATQIALTVPAAVDLRGAAVALVGVGEVAGPPPPAGGEWVAAVRAFALATCSATGANCQVLGASASVSDN